MAEEVESEFDRMVTCVNLPLSVLGGQLYTSNADSDDLDYQEIHLKCSVEENILSSISFNKIGDIYHQPTKWNSDGRKIIDEDSDEEEIGWDISDCNVLVSIHKRDTETFSQAKNNDATLRKRDHARYNSPYNSGDGIINRDFPIIEAQVAIGPENFELLCKGLVKDKGSSFELSLNIEFPSEDVKHGHFNTRITWDEQRILPINDAHIVWKFGDWDTEIGRIRPGWQSSERVEYKPSREHVETMDGLKILQANMIQLATPLWCMVGVTIIASLFWH